MPTERPTDEQLREYLAKLDAIRAAQRRGEDTQAAGAELTRFMIETGIAEQGPTDMFSEDGGSEK